MKTVFIVVMIISGTFFSSANNTRLEYKQFNTLKEAQEYTYTKELSTFDYEKMRQKIIVQCQAPVVYAMY